MKGEMYFRQFLGGFFIPSAFLAIVMAILSRYDIVGVIASWDILLSPFFFGLYNVFYFKIKSKYPIKNSTLRHGAHGAIVFLLVTPFYFFLNSGVHVQHVEMLEIFGPTVNYYWHLLGIIYMPVLAFVWFAFLQKSVNEALGFEV